MTAVALSPSTFSSISMPSEASFNYIAAEDNELAKLSSKGDMQAFEQLYLRHHRKVFTICLRMLRNSSDAEDLAQDVFIQVFRKIKTFRGESKFSTWLHRLAINQVLMYFRKQRKKDGLLRIIFDDPSNLPELPIAGSTDPKNLQTDNQIRLRRAINNLPLGYRSVFILHEIMGFDHYETAAMLGVTEGTTKSQLFKAKDKLRFLLQEQANPKLLQSQIS